MCLNSFRKCILKRISIFQILRTFRLFIKEWICADSPFSIYKTPEQPFIRKYFLTVTYHHNSCILSFGRIPILRIFQTHGIWQGKYCLWPCSCEERYESADLIHYSATYLCSSCRHGAANKKRESARKRFFEKRSLSMSSFRKVLLLLFHLGNSGLFWCEFLIMFQLEMFKMLYIKGYSKQLVMWEFLFLFFHFLIGFLFKFSFEKSGEVYLVPRIL